MTAVAALLLCVALLAAVPSPAAADISFARHDYTIGGDLRGIACADLDANWTLDLFVTGTTYTDTSAIGRVTVLCPLSRGTYGYRVYAIDQAGNSQAAAGGGILRVR